MSVKGKNDTQKIKVIFLNIFCLPLGIDSSGSVGNDNKNIERMELFFSYYGKDADIIILCELWESVICKYYDSPLSKAISVAKKFNFKYHCYKPKRWYEVCNNGMIIFSKYPIKNGSSITYSSSSGSQWFIPKGAILSEILIQKQNGMVVPVMFFATHLHAGPPDNSFMNSDNTAKKVQTNQLLELKNFINKYITKNPHKKWVCVGDFNIDSKKESNYCINYSILRDIIGRDSCLVKYGSPCTYPSFKEGFVGSADNECIDHCFTNIDNIKADVKFLKVRDLSISDHGALYIDIYV